MWEAAGAATPGSRVRTCLLFNDLNGAPVLSGAKQSRRTAIERLERFELLEHLERLQQLERAAVLYRLNGWNNWNVWNGSAQWQ